MKYRIYIVSFFLLLCSVASFAQSADEESIDIEQVEGEDAKEGEEKNEQEPPATPPPPRPSNKDFKPTTEISDDSPVAFPVDI